LNGCGHDFAANNFHNIKEFLDTARIYFLVSFQALKIPIKSLRSVSRTSGEFNIAASHLLRSASVKTKPWNISVLHSYYEL
jgi:hypothetical protein